MDVQGDDFWKSGSYNCSSSTIWKRVKEQILLSSQDREPETLGDNSQKSVL